MEDFGVSGVASSHSTITVNSLKSRRLWLDRHVTQTVGQAMHTEF